MSSRWFNVAVVMLWLATMGWLVRAKLLPPLLVGDPPSYRTILSESPELERPVGWDIELNRKPLGWATSKIDRHEDGMSEIRSRVHLNRLPLAELTPAWMSSLVKIMDDGRDNSPAVIALETVSSLEVDPLGRPTNFRAVTSLGPSAPTAGDSHLSEPVLNISMKGTIEGDQLSIAVQSGEFMYNTRTYFPADGLMSDSLSPQTRLPNLKVGQTWTVPVYSPFRPPNAPLEILHATVERTDPMLWNDRVVGTLLVVYRNDPGSGLTTNQEARAQAWVDKSGLVLKQEFNLLSSKLTFVRRPAQQAVDPGTLPKFEILRPTNPGVLIGPPDPPVKGSSK